jgi:hypothetical protein
VRFAVKYIVCYGLIAGCAVCCKLIAKCAVCRNLLADVANLLRNVRFVQFAKDYIRLPRSYGSPQTAANRNNQPQKKIPDVGPHVVRAYLGPRRLTNYKLLTLYINYLLLLSSGTRFGKLLVPRVNLYIVLIQTHVLYYFFSYQSTINQRLYKQSTNAIF